MLTSNIDYGESLYFFFHKNGLKTQIQKLE